MDDRRSPLVLSKRKIVDVLALVLSLGLVLHSRHTKARRARVARKGVYFLALILLCRWSD